MTTLSTHFLAIGPLRAPLGPLLLAVVVVIVLRPGLARARDAVHGASALTAEELARKPVTRGVLCLCARPAP